MIRDIHTGAVFNLHAYSISMACLLYVRQSQRAMNETFGNYCLNVVIAAALFMDKILIVCWKSVNI